MTYDEERKVSVKTRQSVRGRWSHVLSVLTALLVAAAIQSPVSAQEGGEDEITFGGDEEGGGEITFGEEDADFEFSEEDVEGEGMLVTGVVIRAEESIDVFLADTLTDALMSGLDKLPGYRSVPNDMLKDKFAALGEQGTQDCAYNPICLSKIGEELGIERLVIGRLSGSEGEYNVNIDLINVSERTTDNYISRTVRGDLDDLQKTVKGSLPRLFNIRRVRKRKKNIAPAPVESSSLQRGFAWGTAGLAVAGIGLGVYFGLSASSLESELEEGGRTGGGFNAYTITQRDAQVKLDEAESSALTANVFYGIGLASAVVSGLLFSVTFGEDIATSEESADHLRWSPGLSPAGDGVGVQAEIDF